MEVVCTCMHNVSLPCTAEYNIHMQVSFCDVRWDYNEAKTADAAVYIENVQKHGKSTTVDFVDVEIYFSTSGKNVTQQWYQYWHDKLSTLEFTNIVQVNFKTVSLPSIVFHHSSGPTVIATNTDIVLEGSLMFHTIRALDTIGFSLEELSHLVIQEPTTLFIQLPDSAFPLSSLITALGRPYGGYQDCPVNFKAPLTIATQYSPI